MRFGLIVILTCHELTIAQDSVKLGEIVHNLIFPSEQLMGTSWNSSYILLFRFDNRS